MPIVQLSCTKKKVFRSIISGLVTVCGMDAFFLPVAFVVCLGQANQIKPAFLTGRVY
jgi:hypothetical protein